MNEFEWLQIGCSIALKAVDVILDRCWPRRTDETAPRPEVVLPPKPAPQPKPKPQPRKKRRPGKGKRRKNRKNR